MTDHSLALQATILKSLVAAGISGGRVYDRPPSTATVPYVSLGPSDAFEADADCIEASSVTQQLDVWSETGSFAEASTIAGAIKAVLHRQEDSLVMQGARLAIIEVRSIRRLRDPDGKTSHIAIEVRAIVETLES